MLQSWLSLLIKFRSYGLIRLTDDWCLIQSDESGFTNPDFLSVQIQGKQIGPQPTWMMCCTGPDEHSVYQHYLYCTTNYCNYLLSPKRRYMDIFKTSRSSSDKTHTLPPTRTGVWVLPMLSCNADHKEFSRCHTRGESEESNAHRQWSIANQGSPWIWNLPLFLLKPLSNNYGGYKEKTYIYTINKNAFQ